MIIFKGVHRNKDKKKLLPKKVHTKLGSTKIAFIYRGTLIFRDVMK